MTPPEFVVEFMKAYAMILAAVVWPLAALCMFFVFVYAVRRAVSSFGRKRRVPLTWKGVENVLVDLEHRALALHPRNEGERDRRDLVRREIERGREAIRRQDEKTLLHVFSNLSILAVLDDERVARERIPSREENARVSEPEIIFPESPPSGSR